MPKNTKSRGWLLTINNPTEDELKISEVLGREPRLQYACGQCEVGDEGTTHIQAYIEWKGPRTFQTMHKMFPRAHCEPRGGTASQARDYCTKVTTAVTGTRWEVGVFKEAGKGRGARNDLEEVTKFLTDGGTVSEAYVAYPAVCARFTRFIDRFANMCAKGRDFKTKVIVFKGPTGCGKTSRAHDEYPDIWTKPPGPWYDSYDGQKHVLLDDFDGKSSGISYREFLRLTDRYPMLCPIKGGFVNWKPDVLVITTNIEPRDWYPCEDFAPLERRLDEVHRYPNTGGV